MRRVLIFLTLVIVLVGNLYSQGPRGKSFGFGIILGEPTGLTGKLWLNRENAIDFSVGSSYFGALRFTGDYLWHFDSFDSQVVKLYAGPGLAIGTGESGGWIYKKKDDEYWYRKSDDLGIGVRGLFGLNIIPKRSPLEIFVELGVLVGLTPRTGASGEAAIGIRFYP